MKNKPLAIITGNGLRHPLLCLSATHPLLAHSPALYLSFCSYLSCSFDLFLFLCLLSFIPLSISFSTLLSLPPKIALSFSSNLLLSPRLCSHYLFSRLFPSLWLWFPSYSSNFQTSAFPLSAHLVFYSFPLSFHPPVTLLSSFLIPSVHISPVTPFGAAEQVEDKLISLSLTLSQQQPPFAL